MQFKNFILGIVLGFLFGNLLLVHADKISSPPPLADSPVALQHYLREMYRNFHRLEVVTSNPDGSRQGKKGDMLLLQTGGNSYIEVNSDSSTTWLGIQLSDTP